MSDTRRVVSISKQTDSHEHSAPIDKTGASKAIITESHSVRNKELVSDYQMYKDAYDYLLKLRDLDNTLMWTRANVALILQAGLLAFLANILINLNNVNRFYGLIIATFGLVLSAFWYRLTKGGFYWIRHWQERMSNIEPKMFGNDVLIIREHPHNYDGKTSETKPKNYASTNGAIKLITVTVFTFWFFVFAFMAYVSIAGVPSAIKPEVPTIVPSAAKQ